MKNQSDKLYRSNNLYWTLFFCREGPPVNSKQEDVYKNKFISDHVTKRSQSMFLNDIEANREKLTAEIQGKSVCVIGGAGSIGSSFIRAVLPFKPSKLIVIDLNENGLAELTRDLRSTYGMYVPEEFRLYTLNFADPILKDIPRGERLRHRSQFLSS